MTQDHYAVRFDIRPRLDGVEEAFHVACVDTLGGRGAARQRLAARNLILTDPRVLCQAACRTISPVPCRMHKYTEAPGAGPGSTLNGSCAAP